MAYKCFNCSKKNAISTRGQHHKGVAGGSWKHKAQKSVKSFKANLHQVKVMYDNSVKRVKLCTDCISKLRQKGRLPSGIVKINFAPLKTEAHKELKTSK